MTRVLLLYYRKVRTLYACDAENESELSFEPNQIISNGAYCLFSAHAQNLCVI